MPLLTDPFNLLSCEIDIASSLKASMSVAVKWRHGTRDEAQRKHKNGIVLPLQCCMRMMHILEAQRKHKNSLFSLLLSTVSSLDIANASSVCPCLEVCNQTFPSITNKWTHFFYL
jgi:hypothetical protein